MARHPRARSGRDLRRKEATRPPYPRVLIVCEGSKTEVNYFEEIRQEARLPTVDLRVIQSPLGTEPRQVVVGAEKEFGKTRAFERIYAVFDRDQHLTYADAIRMAEARDRAFKNDEKAVVTFEAIVSVPCFELWLLLHFADIRAPLHRDEAFAQVRRHITGYDKGSTGCYTTILPHLPLATQRAAALKQQSSRLPGDDAYTDVHELVAALRNLKNIRSAI